MKRFATISEFLQHRGMPKPDHPLVYVHEIEAVERPLIEDPKSWVYDFYAVGLKRVTNSADAKLKYGQQEYDYDSGVMSFVAPGQVMSLSLEQGVKTIKQSGWMLLIHPDFLWHTSLAATLKNYNFWDYSVHEALFLSEKEEATLIHILQIIQQECQLNIDAFTKSIIVSHLEALFNYANRFYHRQFITREKANHQLLERFEAILNGYFDNTNLTIKGLPSVGYLAGEINLSPKYLSSLLKVLTGQNTQQHIHEKLIQKAKEKLSTTNLSISEIAYQLGFEHLQSFSKLFKNKTNLSPLEFRASFN
jgi:AraC family transcriptional regulator, transcriptional activator of pobA